MSALLDSDVLIDYLRGQADAVTLLETELTEACISAVSVAELYQGVREGRERSQLTELIAAFTVLPVTTEIAAQAGLFSRSYRASHGCNLADCLIAATAEVHQLRLLTLNRKHYPMLSNVQIPYRKA